MSHNGPELGTAFLALATVLAALFPASPRRRRRLLAAAICLPLAAAFGYATLAFHTWSGADTSFSGDITSDKSQGFVVTYTTGDSTLTSSSATSGTSPSRVWTGSRSSTRSPAPSGSSAGR